jgi:GNAT superfamily N-acetyltransferase
MREHQAMKWTDAAGNSVNDDRELVDVARVHRWLSTLSYWAGGRPFEVVERSIDESLALGLYRADGVQAGFCRWVTDYSTFAWLADVFVDPEVRGRGLGKFLVQSATDHPAIRDLPLQLLGTRDAHGLYRQFGFVNVSEPQRWMERRR